MSEAAAETRSGVVWRRAAALFVVCLVAVGVLAIGLIMGAIPVQFGISKNPFELHLDKLEGSNVTGYAGTDLDVDGGETGVIIAGVDGGQGENLCLATTIGVPVLDELSIKITSGESRPIPLEKVVAHGKELGIGEVVVTDVDLGGDASDFTRSDIIRGPDGTFGIQMDNVDVTDITVAGEKIKVASLQLRGLGLGVKLGDFRLGEHRCEP